MAATTIMYEGPRHSIGTIELDAVTTETHGAEVEITDFPIETGSSITDHVRRKPLTLSMTVVLSDITDSGPVPGRSVDLCNQLYLMQSDAKVLSVYTPAKTYDSMLIQSIGVPRDNKSGCGLTLNVALKQVSLVQNRQTKKVNSRTARAQPKAKAGKTNPVSGPAPTQGQARSVSVLSGLTGVGG